MTAESAGQAGLPYGSARELVLEKWVERAKEGDSEAFGELVRHYRAKALGLADSLTGDAHMAEDIVQEALIRAFLHLGTLEDNRRFMPWLHRIVRNQAYMKLRRGGRFAKERPFASLSSADSAGGAGGGPPDWGDIDAILYHLADHAEAEARNDVCPERHLLRKETLQSIHMLIRCLNKRERAIFEARFFGELPPSEIAELFHTTTAGVYMSLSRSKVKLQKERLRVGISLYVQRRAAQGRPKRNVLPPPHL